MNLPRVGHGRGQTPLPPQTKRAVKLRDGNRCVECGATKRLTIHHIRPISAGGSAMDMRNMETLCKGCHDRKHHLSRTERSSDDG